MMTSVMVNSMLPKRKRGDFQKTAIVPPVVHPAGVRLPSLHRDVTDVWTPLFPRLGDVKTPDAKTPDILRKKHEQEKPTSRQQERTPSPKCKKYRNLFEYRQRYKTDIGLEKRLWKIPNYSTNVLPKSYVNPDSGKTKMKISGLYEQDFRNWYGRLVHENTVILPPIQTSERAKDNVFDATYLNEKRYVMADKRRTGKLETFASDELYLPDVYNQFYTCKECRSNYVMDMYRQKTFRRHKTLTSVSRENTEEFKQLSEQEHCDVLGERYCGSCIEKRNKRFSRDIEDKLVYVRDINKIHYK